MGDFFNFNFFIYSFSWGSSQAQSRLKPAWPHACLRGRGDCFLLNIFIQEPFYRKKHSTTAVKGAIREMYVCVLYTISFVVSVR